MSANYSQEQLSKFKSEKLRQIIIQMQEERAEQDYQYQQSIYHIGQSYKLQVETQKEMISELLISEESLKNQVKILTEKYNFLKKEYEKLSKNLTQTTPKNTSYNNFNSNRENQNNQNQNIQLFAEGLQNSLVIEEEKVNMDAGDQYQIQINTTNATPSIDVTPQNNQIDLKSGQFLGFSTYQQQGISKIGKSANNKNSNNDFLYKSIQSSNYVIFPPDDSFEDQHMQNEPAEKITYLKPNAIQQPKQSENDKKQIRIEMAQKQENLLKKSRYAPQIEKKNNFKESFILNQQISDDNTNNQHYVPSIIQNQYLFISNQLTNQLVENSPICQSQNSTKIGDLFFEDFFIMGPSLSELQTIAQNHPNVTQDTVNPDIYVCFPGKQQNTSVNQRQSLKSFCYPFNVEFQKHQVKSIHQGTVDEIINLQIFKNNLSKNSPNSYVFSLLGDTSTVTDRLDLSQILLNTNPNLSLYFICYTTENFVTVPTTPGAGKEEQNAIYTVPITYCFMTYYPFISHFLDIITEIANNIKLKRAHEYANYYQQIDQTKCTYCQQNNQIQKSNKSKTSNLSPVRERQSEDSNRGSNSTQNSDGSNESKFKCTCKNKNGNKVLSKILELDVESEIETFQSESFANIRKALLNSQKQKVEYQVDLRFKFRNNAEYTLKNYMVPAQNRIVQIEAEWGACLTMSCLPLEDFLYLFTAIALEKKIIFFSSNKSLLSSVILTFFSILKPFTYVYPVIFNLPGEMLGMLEAPVPFIIGINKTGSFKNELEQSGTDFSDKLIVDLDQLKFICTDEMTDYIEKNIPQFAASQKNILENYQQLNMRSSNRLKINSTYKRKGSSQIQHNRTSNQQIQQNCEDYLLYQVTDEQYNSMSQFIEIIRSCLEKYFIKTLPPSQNNTCKDLKQMQERVCAKVKEDNEFIKEFVQTQSYTSYIENMYFSS